MRDGVASRHALASATWVGITVYALFLATGFTISTEWRHYRHLLAVFPAEPRDQLLMLWTLVGKSLVLFFPGLLLASALAWRGLPRATWTMAVTTGMAVIGWLAIDLRVQQLTGNHLIDYLPFLRERNPWEWGGGVWTIAGPLLTIATVVGVAATVTAWLCCRLGRDVTARWPWLRGRPGFLSLGLTYSAVTFGSIPATSAITSPVVMERLSTAMPVPLVLSPRIAPEANADDFLKRFNLAAGLAYGLRHHRITAHRPADETLELPASHRPNVILIVLESLRHDAVDPQWMPRVHAWFREGLRLERHYAGSNASEWGLFALLYGRHPLLYEPTLDARVLPQLPLTLRRAGYRTAFLGSAIVGWKRMDEYINEASFDVVGIEADPAYERWVRDRRTVGRVVTLLRENPSRPLFAMVFPMATHYLYKYPPEYERHVPTVDTLSWMRAFGSGYQSPDVLRGTVNRYRNALAFLDDVVADLLNTLDPHRNLVILTGDHGESFGDDGTWFHLGPLSEIQTHVPMLLRGPGVPTGVIHRVTSHVDVVPTVLHLLAQQGVSVKHTHGHDILAEHGPDQVLLAKPGRPVRAMLVKGAQRLDMTIDIEKPRFWAHGLTDPHAKLQPTLRPNPADATVWVDAFTAELDRLSR